MMECEEVFSSDVTLRKHSAREVLGYFCASLTFVLVDYWVCSSK
jgi:hypothetical protein